ncbi:altronate dehydratase family protein [Streptomyces sp. MBT53]|uniref:UxaA family hydrolase n=1 Tax=Streptomyces sp. MBT53 TaxID=1488384 RepID=UPI0027DA4589|nr:altronate dehydratase family protein [Streptomyces sp. MBT53]
MNSERRTAEGPAATIRPLVPRPGVDDIGLLLAAVTQGTPLELANGAAPAVENIPAGHKVALHDIAKGTPVRKYGEVIGVALADIPAGRHVHVHNLGVGRWEEPIAGPPPKHPGPSGVSPTRDHFLGYRRTDGRAATRNYVVVVPTVNCSAMVARMIAQRADAVHKGTPGLDGVIALPHDLGCGMAEGTPGDAVLRRTLRGYLGHANVAAALLISLGCEVNQPENLLAEGDLATETLTIQQLGGTAATVNAALDRIADLVPRITRTHRTPIPLAELTLGLQCGGSDAYSGLTANPTLGVAADLLVAAGGKVVLGETPEIYGAHHLLRDRATTPESAARIDQLIDWWQEYTAASGATLDNNPSRGNRAGGITTIWEKSLGAVLKSGTSPLNDVVGYAEPVTAPGLTFMDTPGYDPVSATGMVAGGANLLAFTTGRGSLFGSRPVPSLKISTTSELYERMRGDIDFDAGPAMAHTDQVAYGTALFEALVDMASGAESKSEALGFGTEEIVPWRMGAVL